MRTTLYTFLLAMALVLAPVTISWAGTDDSGLQVFELNGTNLGGMQPVTITEDTGIADTLINLKPSKQGYYSLLDFGAISSYVTNITGLVKKIYVDQLGAFVVCQTSPTTGAHEIAVLTTASSIKTSIIPNSGNFFFFFFSGAKYILFDGAPTNTIYTATSLTGTYTAAYHPCWFVTDAVKFKNRLFTSNSIGYLIYYSSATDWADFTVAANKGGVINIGSFITKMIPTSYGLYVFCSDGIYLISGNDTPTSWRIDKISSRVDYAASNVFCDFNNDVYFLSYTRTLYKISGTTVTPISTMPRVFASSIPAFNNCGVVQGRYVIFTNLPNSYYGIIYDLVEQCWFLTTEFSWLVANSDAYYVRQDGNYYSIKMMPNFAESSYSVHGKPVIYPWQWDSAWITLDGNSANMKEIDRIEFEFQGGTSSVGVSRVDSTYAMATYYKTFIPTTNTRITNNVWYSPVGKTPTNKIKFTLVSSGTQTQNVNYIVKKIRIYYRNLGSYGTTRSGK